MGKMEVEFKGAKITVSALKVKMLEILDRTKDVCVELNQFELIEFKNQSNQIR